ncbi:hypothetical protein Q4512_08405 [Oceanihabitans sp. 2_MG-2023]|uniref:hypothetical protein n=1 Tax=Oceanihabitans sp. 2_MG-2023 TaxID=3062661 RepID=UPI0026E1B669|nr:hypothetical protein [Oceanihabitans sp. 2_MG-2023]MDO6596935.1 hypothetical protein [Oceanihabitans sp. 2_MG-2023]
MKNFKTILVFGFVFMLSVSASFAQDKKVLSEKEIAYKEKRASESSVFAKQQIALLEDKYEVANPEQQEQIIEKIKILKKENNIQDDSNLVIDADNKKMDLESRVLFVEKSKQRIKILRERIKKAEANGEMTEIEAKAKKNNLAEMEEKLISHELKIAEIKKTYQK